MNRFHAIPLFWLRTVQALVNLGADPNSLPPTDQLLSLHDQVHWHNFLEELLERLGVGGMLLLSFLAAPIDRVCLDLIVHEYLTLANF